MFMLQCISKITQSMCFWFIYSHVIKTLFSWNVWCPSIKLTELLHTPFPFNREEEGVCKPNKVVEKMVLILNSYSSLNPMSLFLRKSFQVVIIKYHRFEIFKQQLFPSYCSMTKQSTERERVNLLVDETFFSTCRLPLFHYLPFFDGLGCRRDIFSLISYLYKGTNDIIKIWASIFSQRLQHRYHLAGDHKFDISLIFWGGMNSQNITNKNHWNCIK